MTWYKDLKPYSERQLRRDALPTILPRRPHDKHWEAMGAQKLVESQRPVYNPDTHIATSEVQLVNKVPTLVWTVSERPQEEIDAIQAKRAQEKADKEDRQALVNDSMAEALFKARPDQINTYIDNNVTDLASAKAVLKILARAVSLLAKSMFR